MDEFIESCLNETKVNPYTNLDSPHPSSPFYIIEQLMISLYPLITFKLMDTANSISNDLPVFLTPKVGGRGWVTERCLAIFNQGKAISIDKYRYVMQFEFLPKLQSFLDERETKLQEILDKFNIRKLNFRNRGLYQPFKNVKPILEDYFNETFDTDPREVIIPKYTGDTDVASGGPNIESWKSYLDKKLNYRDNQLSSIMDKFTKISHDLPMENIQSYLVAIEGEEGDDDL